jgi:DNA integrity scanning protein DisA with diadenylate cyclase activity
MVKRRKVISISPDAPSKRNVVKACIDIALQNTDHGCIFVIELNHKRREKYYAKVFQKLKNEKGHFLSVLKDADKHIIKHLAGMDGATLIDDKGHMLEFGVTLREHITFFGHGKRHAFALGTSRLKNLVCILASEEDRNVRIFRDGMCIVDIDSNSYVPEKLRYEMADMLVVPLPRGISAPRDVAMPAIIVNGGELVFTEGFEALKKMF